MEISCCMIATNKKNRFELLRNTINSIDNCSNDLFKEKILSIDMFPSDSDLTFTNEHADNGWVILNKKVDQRRSMILNQKNSISKSTSEIILYSEEDIIVNKIPKKETIDKLFNTNCVNGKPVGFISYNNHVWINFNENPKHIIDYINDINNYVIIDDEVFLVKSDVIKDRYYLNFPVCITRKDLFLETQEYCLTNNSGIGVEAGMTNAWFQKGLNNKYEVLIYLKNNIIDDIKAGKKITVLEFYNYANMNFWNNDTSLRHESIDNRVNTIF